MGTVGNRWRAFGRWEQSCSQAIIRGRLMIPRGRFRACVNAMRFFYKVPIPARCFSALLRSCGLRHVVDRSSLALPAQLAAMMRIATHPFREALHSWHFSFSRYGCLSAYKQQQGGQGGIAPFCCFYILNMFCLRRKMFFKNNLLHN